MESPNYGKRKFPQFDQSVLLQIRSTHWEKFNQSVVINCTSFYPPEGGWDPIKPTLNASNVSTLLTNGGGNVVSVDDSSSVMPNPMLRRLTTGTNVTLDLTN